LVAGLSPGAHAQLAFTADNLTTLAESFNPEALDLPKTSPPFCNIEAFKRPILRLYIVGQP
jgi:hypothetical protein